jgi:hypothetical protein
VPIETVSAASTWPGRSCSQPASGERTDEPFKARNPTLVLLHAVAHGRFRGAAFEAFADMRADHLAVGNAKALRFSFDAREQVRVETACRRQQPGMAGSPFASKGVSHAA